jgi:aspartate--ammonia ligase
LDGSESKSALRFTVLNQDIPRGIVVDEASLKESPYVMECEIVQSLAKWKRIMLDRLDIPINEGIYCDSTSIRKGYKGDVTHSVVADQWDFEIHIKREQRTVDQLKQYVRTIYKIITDGEDMILKKYPAILAPPGHPTADWRLPKEIHFTSAEEIHREFPGLDVHGRENAAVKKYGLSPKILVTTISVKLMI